MSAIDPQFKKKSQFLHRFWAPLIPIPYQSAAAGPTLPWPVWQVGSSPAQAPRWPLPDPPRRTGMALPRSHWDRMADQTTEPTRGFLTVPAVGEKKRTKTAKNCCFEGFWGVSPQILAEKLQPGWICPSFGPSQSSLHLFASHQKKKIARLCWSCWMGEKAQAGWTPSPGVGSPSALRKLLKSP